MSRQRKRLFSNTPALEDLREDLDGNTGLQVFLGGTIKSNWRDVLIPKLTIPYFNPVVKDWTPEDQKKEELEKKRSSHQLYVITPKQVGFYSIAEFSVAKLTHAKSDLGELVDVIVCFLNEDEGVSFTPEQVKSNEAIVRLFTQNDLGVKFLDSLDNVASYLNGVDNATS